MDKRAVIGTARGGFIKGFLMRDIELLQNLMIMLFGTNRSLVFAKTDVNT